MGLREKIRELFVTVGVDVKGNSIEKAKSSVDGLAGAAQKLGLVFGTGAVVASMANFIEGVRVQGHTLSKAHDLAWHC